MSRYGQLLSSHHSSSQSPKNNWKLLFSTILYNILLQDEAVLSIPSIKVFIVSECQLSNIITFVWVSRGRFILASSINVYCFGFCSLTLFERIFAISVIHSQSTFVSFYVIHHLCG